MDLLTQGLIGSGIALSIARPDELRKAALIGLLAGVSADVDFFIQSSNDPLLNLEFHRHFTHSLFFIPIAALLLSVLFWPFFRKHLSWSRIYAYALAGYLLSGFIDACTSYGTRLFWPVSDERISLNIISIIDPVFTLLLLIALGTGIGTNKNHVTRLFFLLAAGYLLLGSWQKHRIQHCTEDYARLQGHRIERLLVKPTLGNNWLWRSVYQHQEHYYVNALRINPFTGSRSVYPGDKIQLFSPGENSLQLPEGSVLENDIRRFAYFSDQYLAVHPENPKIIIDVRYANLPNSVLPLWGIRIDKERPQQHARYEIYRDKTTETRQAFISMLLDEGSQTPAKPVNKPAGE